MTPRARKGRAAPNEGAPQADDPDEDAWEGESFEEEPEVDLSELPSDWLHEVERRIEGMKVARRERGNDERKTMDEVFDKSTLLTLWKFISNGLFETLDYPVSTGKEANVFHATTRAGGALAVKIFRTNTTTFRSHLTYILGDPRFGKVGKGRRDIVYTWAQKEYKNLQRYYEAGVRVPTPIAHHTNVLVMEFVGTEGTPAPLLKEAPPEDPKAAYEDVTHNYALGFEGGLVHGDFSEFNILHRHVDDEEDLVIIDVAQAVLTRHPMARDLLQRDARNVARYFSKLGVRAATPADALARMAPKPQEATRE